ncbi:periodic tryptophan protein 1, putative [Plasmodium ovale wallikeri]|uniref:Periodic tryptophan protein 1, putative n=1 Tax=Plasmodium ovale wallikeri TaxID=864142 RepID=A0A1A9A186_PLAOA|nr:periodic tryptophan protein 1, putative [Plasmodium ovale wallikeri]
MDEEWSGKEEAIPQRGYKKAEKKKKLKKKKNAKNEKKHSIISCISVLSKCEKRSGKIKSILSENDELDSSCSEYESKKKKKKMDKLREDENRMLNCIFNDEKKSKKVIKRDDIIASEQKYIYEDELSIEESDALVLNGRICSDMGTLEVHIFNYEQSIFNIYDDVIIDTYPLCLQVIHSSYYNNRNVVAVGTMNKEISLWDINNIDTMEPLCYLGEKAMGAKRTKREKKRKKRITQTGEMEVGIAVNVEETPETEVATCTTGDEKTSEQRNMQGHGDCVTCLNSSKIIPHLLCSGSKDRTIKLWDLSRLSVLHTFNFHEKKINNVGFHSKKADLLFSTSSDKTLKIYDIRKNKVALNINLESTPESTLWSTHEEYAILSSDVDGYISKIDIRGSTSSPCNSIHGDLIRFKAFDSSCVSLISTSYKNLTLAGSEEGIINVYDFGTFTESGQPRCVYTKNLRKVKNMHLLHVCNARVNLCTYTCAHLGQPLNTKQLLMQSSPFPSPPIFTLQNLYYMKENEDWPNVVLLGCDVLYDWDMKLCEEIRNSVK